MPRRRRSSLPILFILAATFGAGLLTGWSGVLPNPVTGQPAGIGRVTTPFWEAWQLVEEQYVDRSAVDRRKMARGAITGMLDTLGDVGHTEYLTPEDVRRMRDELKGELEGIGIRLTMRQQRPTVVWVVPGSPAQKAGVRAGDVLLQVDGKEVKEKSLSQIVELVVGAAGTPVTLSLAREGQPKPIDLEVTRARLALPDVTWHKVPGQPLMHIAIQSFGEKADEQLRSALDAARASGARGLVIDLRGNPGGLFDQAVAVTSEFLSSGDVLIEQDAHGRRTPVPVKPGGTATDIPMVVIVDEGTASSAEIFAGAMQDHGRAKVVGTKTFGTGTVLEPFPLSDGSAVLLAVRQWLTPKGRQIWHKGIEPDVPVALPEGATIVFPEEAEGLDPAGLVRSRDTQLLKAIELLRGK